MFGFILLCCKFDENNTLVGTGFFCHLYKETTHATDAMFVYQHCAKAVGYAQMYYHAAVLQTLIRLLQHSLGAFFRLAQSSA